MKVVVGSTNPVKINAAKQAFEKLWPDDFWEVVGHSAPSEVSDQPISDNESIIGARNRARYIMREYQPDYAVGLEGGLQEIDNVWFICGWAVVIDSAGVEGVGSTFKLPVYKQVMDLVLQGMEVGEADDQIFGFHNTKQNLGHFGLMTKGVLSRTMGYTNGVIAALSVFTDPESHW